MSDHEKRMENERKIVRHLIRHAKEKGWIATRVDDGGEPDEIITTATEAAVMDAVFAVDEAQIEFVKGGRRMWVMIILGNGNMGFDLIADYNSDGGDFDVMMDEVNTYIEGLEG